MLSGRHLPSIPKLQPYGLGLRSHAEKLLEVAEVFPEASVAAAPAPALAYWLVLSRE